MRHIVLDTETTGLDPASGHRVIEIGCVELVNHIPSGKVFHHYINPERDVPKEAENVHGISTDFLKDKPLFAEIAGDFLDFIAADTLVIHNAAFDMGFLNAELTRHGFERLPPARALDTVQMARKKFPGAPASLDALCKRFNVDTSARTYHGALLDARLLADVYLELIGGRQVGLGIDLSGRTIASSAQNRGARTARPARAHAPSEAEDAAHEAAIGAIKGHLWK